MWHINTLNIESFRSFLEAKITLLQNKTTMIFAENLDDSEGADSNGSGKSNLLLAIKVCLLGARQKGFSKEDFINDDMNECVLILEMYNTKHKMNLTIERYLSRKEAERCVLIENGKENKKLTSLPEANKRILELLAISEEDLLNYFLIDQGNSHSFFSSTDTTKKEILSRFSNTHVLDPILKDIDLRIKKTSSECHQTREAININLSKIEVLNENLDFEVNGRLQKQAESVKQKGEQLIKEKERLVEYEQNILNLNKKIQSISSKVKNIEDIEKSLKKKETIKQEVKNKIETLTEEIEESLSLAQDLALKLKKVIVCPKCNHNFIPSDIELEVSEVEAINRECVKLIERIRNKKKNQNLVLGKIIEDVSKLKEEAYENKSLKSRLSLLSVELNETNEFFESQNKLISKLKNEVNEVKNFEIDSKRIANIKKEILELEIENKEFELFFDKRNSDLEDLNFWKLNFGYAGFKTFLTNKVLSTLESRVNNVMSLLNVGFSCKINGFTVNKSGEMRDKIEVFISKGGTKWSNYNRFSGGQQHRLDICGVITLHSLINSTCESGGLNFLGLDEFFEGLDSKGQEDVISILENSGITNWVVSHNNKNIGFENELWIKYEDRVSNLM